LKLLVFDNYDSFTYNLVHLVEKILHRKVDVCFNDTIDLKEIQQYDKIILSPGPGIPEEAGLLLPLLHKYAASKSILGVCLGHQAIGQAFGASLINLDTVYHGVAVPLKEIDQESRLFKGIPVGTETGRYHSWIIDDNSVPEVLKVTARDENGFIMAVAHKEYDVQGVQFHPESILTDCGEQLLRNWLD
jgi:anthranilate synthase component 2